MADLRTIELLRLGCTAIRFAAARARTGPLSPDQVPTREQAGQIMEELWRMGGTPLAVGRPYSEELTGRGSGYDRQG